MRSRRIKILTEQALPALALVIITATALFLRFYGIDWDQGYFFHPDERQVYYVTDALALPQPLTLSALLDPEGTWNPNFFAYGSLPMYLLRLVTDVAKRAFPAYGVRYANYILGRGLSALFDVGTVLLVYVLGRRLYGRATGLLAAALSALAVLHIQLSHFYTVDTLLAFFVLAVLVGAVRLAQRGGFWSALPIGAALGAAMGTKVSAAPLAVIVALAWLLAARRQTHALSWHLALSGCVLSGVVTLGVFAFCEPFAFVDWGAFVVGVARESLMVQGGIDWPYTRQYIGTLPYLYLFWQTSKWSLGLPLGLAGFAGAIWVTVRQVRRLIASRLGDLGAELLLVSWFLLYFGLVGGFHTKFLRYMLPVIPLLCLWGAHLSLSLWQGRRVAGARWGRVVLPLVLAGTGLYAAAFMNIYRHEHTWVRATEWICAHYKRDATIMVESWDDPLPLWQGQGNLRCMGNYHFQFFEAHDEDTQDKLDMLLTLLVSSDYVGLSSNRLYNSLPRLPERFPLTTRYYQLLLGEQLGFELVHYEETHPALFGVTLADDTFSNPDLPVPALLASVTSAGLRLNLGRADESFTVYDHPKPLLFAKTRALSREELLALLGDAAQGLPAGAE